VNPSMVRQRRAQVVGVPRRRSSPARRFEGSSWAVRSPHPLLQLGIEAADSSVRSFSCVIVAADAYCPDDVALPGRGNGTLVASCVSRLPLTCPRSSSRFTTGYPARQDGSVLRIEAAETVGG
jgi:hypothetical protein